MVLDHHDDVTFKEYEERCIKYQEQLEWLRELQQDVKQGIKNA